MTTVVEFLARLIMARFLTAASLVAAVSGDSITSCGSATDHFQITTLNLDADATGGPRKGQPFTVTVEGVLDEAHTAGSVDVSLNVKALGLINEDVAVTQAYEFLPGLPAAPHKLVIGPFTLPKSIPGKIDVSGRVVMANDKGEQLACVDLALIIPSILEEEKQDLAATTDCTTASDHLQNIVVDSSVAGQTTTTMDIDEPIGDLINVGVDLRVKVPLLPAVQISLTQIPISLSPAIPAGQLTFVIYDPPAQSNALLTVTGQVSLQDGKGEQITCIAIDAVGATTTDVVV